MEAACKINGLVTLVQYYWLDWRLLHLADPTIQETSSCPELGDTDVKLHCWCHRFALLITALSRLAAYWLVSTRTDASLKAT